MGTALFRALDTNNDGKLDAQEIAAAADVLKKLANSSGEITAKNYCNRCRRVLGRSGRRWRKRRLWRTAWRWSSWRKPE